jgi:large subunit ribosomal protein L4e
MAARPVVSTYSTADGKSSKATIALPAVFLAPIRPDVVTFVHSMVSRNRRQAYSVNEEAGHQTSAESWGTGRAVARIPRVAGGGTSRAGQGAFGNMCRGGRMFAPTKTWRRWHRHANLTERRHAICSALAASAVPSLVMARGHRVERVPEVPLVVDDSIQAINKTKDALKIFETIGALDDINKAKESRQMRTGSGKHRNRRYVNRRGPLVVFGNNSGITKAIRNLPGVDVAHVDRLNLLQLAPGGHLGRFVIWTASAFARLDSLYSSKAGYTIPRPMVTNADLDRIITSEEIQSKLRAKRLPTKRTGTKPNPLTNLRALAKLNPYAIAARRSQIKADANKARKKAAKVAKKRCTPEQVKKAKVVAKRGRAFYAALRK